MKHISRLSREEIDAIRLVVFDVDGVLVPRGTRIMQDGDTTTLHTKRIKDGEIERISRLHHLGYMINISSGRGLYMLQEMFRGVLSSVSLTYENGSATWDKGNVLQHFNSHESLSPLYPELRSVADSRIKGFEPKEFIITIHCHERVGEIEKIVSGFPSLYTVWNGEAYDIGVKGLQTKGVGLREYAKHLGLSRRDILAIGDNLNDKELLENAGIAVSADKTRVSGDFYIDMSDIMPASVLMDRIISLD